MSSSAQPALAQPLIELSPNRSKRQRNHTISAAIQMKNQKLHNRTSPKSVVIASMVIPSRHGPTHRPMSGVSQLSLPDAKLPGRETSSVSATAMWSAAQSLPTSDVGRADIS